MLPGKHRVLLKDLDDPMVGIVSFVKHPAVRDARFFCLKSEQPASGARTAHKTLEGQIRSLPRDGGAAALKAALGNG